ncbi:unnamed protein product [Prorocentrum cordatum]|uniref:Uncharacterized protein n=1 Tax=Prorocentrum cordatum TaxID=2364126 RepID=A0ABN9SDS5_9DINO|nr:unnamed protein product [Polarella glacialis]
MISSDSLSPSRNRSAGPSTISFLTESRSRFRWGPSASTPPARSRPGRPCTECRRAPRRGPGGTSPPSPLHCSGQAGEEAGAEEEAEEDLPQGYSFFPTS